MGLCGLRVHMTTIGAQRSSTAEVEPPQSTWFGWFARDGSFNGLQFEFWVTTFFLSWSKTHMTKRTNRSSCRWGCQRDICVHSQIKNPTGIPSVTYIRVLRMMACDRCRTLLFQMEYCSILYSNLLQRQTLAVYFAGSSEKILFCRNIEMENSKTTRHCNIWACPYPRLV